MFGFFRGLQVFLGRGEGFVAEPFLHGSHVYACAQPARCGRVPEAMKMPFLRGFKTGPALSETFSLYKSVPWPAYSTHCSNRISSPRSCSPLSFLSNWSPNWSPMRSAVQSGTSGDTAPLAPSGRDADLLRGRALHYHAYCPLHEVRARHMPRARGKLSRLAGNYGKPLCGRATDANSVDEI